MPEKKVITATKEFIRWLCAVGSLFGFVGLSYILMFFFTPEKNREMYILVGTIAAIFGVVTLTIAYQNHCKMRRILNRVKK